ncbi:hypothetical protein Tco_1029749 [Tanacetum coccineum]|uniref:Uncharacterized protein n=1 Tax=Tanacetum coccineum TaxID=301880 RepID=A0ABQ5G5U6_9ASTR
MFLVQSFYYEEKAIMSDEEFDNLKEDRTKVNTCFYACFLSQIEPTSIAKALSDSSWVEEIQEELLQFKLQQVWILVDLSIGKRAIGTKWVFRNKKDERGIVLRNKARSGPSKQSLQGGQGTLWVALSTKSMDKYVAEIFVTPPNSLQRKTRFGMVTSWREEDLLRETELYMPIYQCRLLIFRAPEQAQQRLLWPRLFAAQQPRQAAACGGCWHALGVSQVIHALSETILEKPMRNAMTFLKRAVLLCFALFLKESSEKDRKLHLSMYGSGTLERQMGAKLACFRKILLSYTAEVLDCFVITRDCFSYGRVTSNSVWMKKSKRNVGRRGHEQKGTRGED